MPKMKSNSGAKKRFRFTASGKVKFKKAYHSHILTSKTTKVKRKMRKTTVMSESDMPQIRRLLPYGR
ncbi:MAG: 50S ribosomal protein L35 [Pseudomonadota bacterium]